ncbi:neuronal acetylcholine receptor subunit alpha-2-like [Ruditapes philippinarum]|uniref:neuronal acetylcholine receptor subunit alpha-2-like n=1 Tax=Ruditapes philippinarum TaxID=129788 RepID=UPI00295A7548|nr:neuronal acetylcholine receptor subunit alpha-2-like [Ruditapes philippinarum]
MYILEFHFRILCLLLFQNLGVQTVYSPEKEAEIRNEEIKIASYDMISRPKAQTVVKIKLSILAIDELDLKSQKLTSAGWLSFEWEDDRINWTPSAKDDIEEIFSKPADIWKPELVVDNSFDDVGVISNSDLYLRVKSTGVVEWEPPMSFVTHCTVDITYYPYDKQICSVNIISWGFTAQEVMLEPADTPVNLDDFETHGEWEILSSRAEKLNVTESTIDGGTIRVFPYVAFWLRLKRRSSFYNLNIVMPVFVTSLLVALTFIVPLESGEKLSYILTVFLALAVLLTLVADSLPSTSISTSVLGLYLGIVTVLAAFGILLTVLILLLYHKEGPSKKSPSGIMGITYFAAICTCSAKSLRNNKVTPINDKFESDDDEAPESRTVYEADWKEIAVILDRFCFMMFSIITIVMNVSFVITLTAGGASYEPSE